MKIFKAFFAVILACCCLLSAIPAMAAEVDSNMETTYTVETSARVDNQFTYPRDGTTFTLTRDDFYYFTYTSGTFGKGDEWIVVTFRNLETGYICNHSLQGSTVNPTRINCNADSGTYQVTFTQNPKAVGEFHIVFHNTEIN